MLLMLTRSTPGPVSMYIHCGLVDSLLAPQAFIVAGCSSIIPHIAPFPSPSLLARLSIATRQPDTQPQQGVVSYSVPSPILYPSVLLMRFPSLSLRTRITFSLTPSRSVFETFLSNDSVLWFKGGSSSWSSLYR